MAETTSLSASVSAETEKSRFGRPLRSVDARLPPCVSDAQCRRTQTIINYTYLLTYLLTYTLSVVARPNRMCEPWNLLATFYQGRANRGARGSNLPDGQTWYFDP